MSQEVSSVTESLAKMSTVDSEASDMAEYFKSRIVAFERLKQQQAEERQKKGGEPIT